VLVEGDPPIFNSSVVSSVEQASINGIPKAASTIGLQAVFKKFLRLFISFSLFKDKVK
jgi:hypothetical protein